MSVLFRQTIAALSLLSVACNAPKLPAHSVDSTFSAESRLAIRDSVKAVLNEFTTKMNSGDLDGAGRLYSEDTTFSWVESGSLSYRTARDVRDALKTLHNIPQIKLVYYETQIDVLAPNVASVRTEFSQTFMDKAGKGTTYGGYLTMSVVREKDGWRFRNGHSSSRKPRPGL